MVTTVAKGINRKRDGEIASITFDYKRYGALMSVFCTTHGIDFPVNGNASFTSEDVPNETTMAAYWELKSGGGTRFSPDEDIFAYLDD